MGFIMDINTLTELLRKEKRSPYLQKVDDDFYSKLGSFVAEYYDEYPEHSKERINLEKIVIDLYNARERKVVLNALSFARFKKEPDMDNLVPEEEKTLEEIIEALRMQRGNLLKLPSSRAHIRKDIEKPSKVAEKVEPEESEKETRPIKEPPTPESPKKNVVKKTTVRILEDMPQIVGVDGNTYGSFKVEDVVTLPEANARIFIKKGAAEIIQTKD